MTSIYISIIIDNFI